VRRGPAPLQAEEQGVRVEQRHVGLQRAAPLEKSTGRVSCTATSFGTEPGSKSDCWWVATLPSVNATSASSRHFFRLSEMKPSGW